MVEFKGWPKIYRVSQTKVVITEKIDGTNACVIVKDGDVVGAQSRKRLITPEADNFGFARWVENNRWELAGLGDGYHYGEWAGPGIQKNPHNLDEKTFFLFNTGRWSDVIVRPACCEVVRVIYAGPVYGNLVAEVMSNLWDYAKGYYKPEGVVVYFPLTDTMQKETFENCEGKWKE